MSRCFASSRVRVRQSGYVLLETVIATGLLIVGLAVIGAQVQSSDTLVRNMDRELRAMMLAEQQLAELDLGLIQLDSLNEVEDGDFGSRQPDWGWVMTTVPTVVGGLFRVRIDVMYLPRDGDYQEDSFDFDNAERMFTAYAFRATPRPIDFGADYGLSDDEVEDLASKFADLGIPIDISNFNPGADMLGLPFDELVGTLPLIMEAMGLNLDQLTAALPKEVLDQLREAGVFGEQGDAGADDAGDTGDANTGGGTGSEPRTRGSSRNNGAEQ